jgi:hypothetical protein
MFEITTCYCLYMCSIHGMTVFSGLSGCYKSSVYPSLFFYSGSRSTKTFKPKKNIPEGTHQYDLMKHAAATLGSGNLRLAVVLPDGEDLNEWVAVNSTFPCPSCSFYALFYLKTLRFSFTIVRDRVDITMSMCTQPVNIRIEYKIRKYC